MSNLRGWLRSGVLVLCGVAGAVGAADAPAGPATAAPTEALHWVAAWASAQQVPEPRNALPAQALRDATLRQIAHLSIGGTSLRVRLSNAFGMEPLRIASARVARVVSAETGEIDPATDRALAFAGRRDVIIPPGADYLSDPLDFPVERQSDLAISLHLDAPPERETGHPGSRETSFLVRGDHVSAPRLDGAQRVEHWYFLSGVQVAAAADAATVVALGDSITDGHGATTNGNDRWPDDLARRLASEASALGLSVVNAGIGGNRLLADGLGPNALARFDRDVLGQAAVRDLIVLEGINDLGVATSHGVLTRAAHEALVGRITAAYGQLIARAHAAGLRVMGGTLTPDAGSSLYHPDAAAESDRQAVNAWIRAAGHFDAVADFDAALRDPAHPDRLRPAYDSGDHLHPSPVGYLAMVAAIPLDFFRAPVRESAAEVGARLSFEPLHASGIYARGERVGWSVKARSGEPLPRGPYSYVVQENDDAIVDRGTFDPSSATAAIETSLDHPAMLYVTVKWQGEPIATLGAAVDPTGLEPTSARPADFDAFWRGKLAALARVPMHPILVPMPTRQRGVELYRVRLDSLGSHVQGYLAFPHGASRLPALVIYQYAGVYALDPKTVTDRAAQGWLAFDVDSHDLPPDQATGVPSSYDAIGDTDRETSYFLGMYLRDTRAIDYIRTNPHWDHRTVVLTGTSMGGQQSLVTAGLNPGRVSAVIVNEPSGADSSGALHGRYVGYPWWHKSEPRVLATARYFDTVNFASRIEAPTLVSMGFIDTIAPPAGIWTALDRIPAPKEAVPLVESDHNNLTPQKQGAYLQRSEEVLATLLVGRRFVPDTSLTRPPD
jgi:cephalosporin-C deacetylase-like acetyl esterase/lysophospholipase L1-like esterase